MAVINVIEDGAEREVRETLTTRTTDRAFTVVFDENDDPLIRPLLAVRHPQIPLKRSQYPGDSALFVINRQARIFEGPFSYKVTCYYSGNISGGESDDPYSDGESSIDPLNQPPVIEWTFAESNEPIDRDIAGKIITNSAGETFDPTPAKTVHDLVLRYTRNKLVYSAWQAFQYIGSLNSDDFLGFGPGLVKCTVFNGQKIYNDEYGNYWRVTHEFQFRKDYIEGEGYIGWKRRISDQGYRENYGVKEDGSPDLRDIMVSAGNDADGNPSTEEIRTSQPVLLNGKGRKLPGNAEIAYYLKDAVFQKFDLYEQLPFSVLNITA